MGTGNDNLPKLLNTILNSFIDLCGCDGGSIFTVKIQAPAPGPVVASTVPTPTRSLAFATMVTRSMKLDTVPVHLRNLSFPFDESSLVGRTATQKRSFRVSQADQQKTRVSSGKVDSILSYETRNILSAPLITPRGDLVGVVQLLNKNPTEQGVPREFDEQDERLFGIVAGQAALAIENSLLLDEQERLLEGFVDACVTAIEARDPTTSGHSTRVAEYSVALAEAVSRTRSGPLAVMQFSAAQIREIRFAAMLHDIGKISVREAVLMKEKKLYPWELEVIRMRLKLMRAELLLQGQISGQMPKEDLERVDFAWRQVAQANEPTVVPVEVGVALGELQKISVISSGGETLHALTRDESMRLSIKKGTLTPEERLEIERHVSHTYEILKKVPWGRSLEGVPEIAHYHHEKLNGSGYPRKLVAPAIPIQSRMLAICDIYDALTADDRPYKNAVPLDRALDILKTEVDEAKLDGRLFDVFVQARVYEAVVPKKRTQKKAA